MLSDKFFFYLHYLLICSVITGPFITFGWIKPYILFLIMVIIQWFVLKENVYFQCYKKSSQNEGAISRVLKIKY